MDRNHRPEKEMAKFETIRDIDFTDLYKHHYKLANRNATDAQFWDQKASALALDLSSVYSNEKSEKSDESEYQRAFLQKLELREEDVVLDVGCGAGSLALKIAPNVKKVICLDFSEKMLDLTGRLANMHSIENFELCLKSWYDNWDDVEEADICISSRSSMVSDIEDALNKLNQKARRAVYMSMRVDPEYINRALYQLLNRDHLVRFPSYIYAVNILYQQGYLVSVTFIDEADESSINTNSQLSQTEFISHAESVISDLTDFERELLLEYYANNVGNLLKINRNTQVWALLHWYK